jgi:hypothetical protein
MISPRVEFEVTTNGPIATLSRNEWPMVQPIVGRVIDLHRKPLNLSEKIHNKQNLMPLILENLETITTLKL